MCDYCIKHGVGGKWYLNAENYSALNVLVPALKKQSAYHFETAAGHIL
jgi:hypothetical protein